MTRERVVVTGLSLMSGLGLDLGESWRNLLAGHNPVDRFSSFESSDLRACFGVELPTGADEHFKKIIKPRRRKQMTRATMISIATAKMAIDNQHVPAND